MLVPGLASSVTFCAKMLNADVQLAPSIPIYWFFIFVLQICSRLKAGKTPATKNVHVPQIPCLMVGDGQLDLEEAGQAKDNCGMEFRG